MLTTSDLQFATQRSLKAMQRLLHGEVAAAETYGLAIERLGGSAPFELTMCLQSHLQRVEKLTVHLFELGAKPDVTSGVGGTFFKLIESGGALLGERAAIGILEEGEDHGVAEYRQQINQLSPDSRRFVVAELLAEQVRTYDVMSELCYAATEVASSS